MKLKQQWLPPDPYNLARGLIVGQYYLVVKCKVCDCNTTLRERFSLADEEYQAVSAVIADAKKARRIVAADPTQGKRNARYVPYWVGE